MSDPVLSENRYDLYELAVQDPEREVSFLGAVHGNQAVVLAEDFSGPASLCRAWIALGDERSAIATDRDKEPLEHCVRRLAESMGRGAVDRLTIATNDVLEAPGRADIIAGLNFGCFELHEREQLVTYFRHALFRLEFGGVLVLDTYGGDQAWTPGVSACTIETDSGAFMYEWEQLEANPLNGRVSNAIHFTLPDGRRIEGAFRYDWRLWSAPEIRDAMLEAGFACTEVYTRLGDAVTDEGELLVSPASTDRDDPASAAPEDVDEAFVCYVVGRVSAPSGIQNPKTMRIK